MRYIKMLGLAAVAAAALMAFVGAGTASATELYDTSGTLGVGTTIHADLEEGTEAILEAGFGNINCDASTVHGTISVAGSSTTTTSGPITKGGLTFGNCTGDTVTVLKEGSLEIHHIAGTTDGTLTSSGAEVTVVNHDTGGTHCIYKTDNTDIGRLTSGKSTTATLHADAKLIRVPTSFLCASEATRKASYVVTTPHEFWVEQS